MIRIGEIPSASVYIGAFSDSVFASLDDWVLAIVNKFKLHRLEKGGGTQFYYIKLERLILAALQTEPGTGVRHVTVTFIPPKILTCYVASFAAMFMEIYHLHYGDVTKKRS